MDVLERLNGMLIKGLVCCLGHKAHHQIHNVPLETSVTNAETKQPYSPAAPHTKLQSQYGWFGLENVAKWKEFKFCDPAAAL